MKLATALALALLSPIVLAQTGPPPRGQAGPPAPTGNGMNRPNGAPSRTAPRANETETIRLLGMRSVQTDLALTSSEVVALGSAAQALRNKAATEDAALSAVSKILTAAQASRLKELIVQDLDYNSLALSDVRAQLTLTDDQANQIEALVLTLETAKAALAASADVRVATRAKATLMAKTGSELAKLLTTEQDAKLRALAGQALGGS